MVGRVNGGEMCDNETFGRCRLNIVFPKCGKVVGDRVDDAAGGRVKRSEGRGEDRRTEDGVGGIAERYVAIGAEVCQREIIKTSVQQGATFCDASAVMPSSGRLSVPVQQRSETRLSAMRDSAR